MEDLPPELLMTIFRFVKKNDLLNICLVSNKFLRIASSSVFWKEVELSKKKLANKNAAEEFLTRQRFKGSEFLKLSGNIRLTGHYKTSWKNYYEDQEQIKHATETYKFTRCRFALSGGNYE